MSKEQLIGQASEEQVAAWKKECPDGIYAIKFKEHIAYFKNPNRHEVNCTLAKADPEKVTAMYEELAELTYLGGSREVFDNDQKLLGYMNQVKVKLEGEKAELVNL